MTEIKNKIKTETETFVTTKCLRGFNNISIKLNYKTCKSCPLLISKSECGYTEYIVDAKKSIDKDEDDVSGGMPFDTYMWYIPCSECGNEILFTSGFSCLQLGDNSKCKKCGKEHFHIKWIKDDTYKFGVPIKRSK